MASRERPREHRQSLDAPPSYESVNGNTSWVRDLPSPPTHVPDIRANSREQSTIASIQAIEEVGFPREWAIAALRRCQGNIEEAIIFCMENGETGMEAFVREDMELRAYQQRQSNQDQTSTSSKSKKGGIFHRLFSTKKASTSTSTTGSSSIDSPTLSVPSLEQRTSHDNNVAARGISSPTTHTNEEEIRDQTEVMNHPQEDANVDVMEENHNNETATISVASECSMDDENVITLQDETGENTTPQVIPESLPLTAPLVEATSSISHESIAEDDNEILAENSCASSLSSQPRSNSSQIPETEQDQTQIHLEDDRIFEALEGTGSCDPLDAVDGVPTPIVNHVAPTSSYTTVEYTSDSASASSRSLSISYPAADDQNYYSLANEVDTPRAAPVVSLFPDTVNSNFMAEAMIQVHGSGTDNDRQFAQTSNGQLYLAVAAPLEDEDPMMSSNNNNRTRRPSKPSVTDIIRRSLYGEGIEAHTNLARGDHHFDSGVRSREFLPYKILVNTEDLNQWKAVISLKQPKLRGSEYSPQGSKPEVLVLGVCSSRLQALAMCEAMRPPLWASKDPSVDVQACIICRSTWGLLRRAHHCRNCGYLVCNQCSSKSWPSAMLPPTYHNNEKYVRVCDSCHVLTEKFADALRTGKYAEALAIHSTGNVNLHNPLLIYVSAEYPIHCAAAGGNLAIFRWLVEEQHCTLFSKTDGKALTTKAGLSVLAVAAKHGHADIMRYCVHRAGSKVTEITNTSLLLRGLHASLNAPGPLPEYQPTGGFFGAAARDDPVASAPNSVASPSSANIAVATAQEAQVYIASGRDDAATVATTASLVDGSHDGNRSVGGGTKPSGGRARKPNEIAVTRSQNSIASNLQQLEGQWMARSRSRSPGQPVPSPTPSVQGSLAGTPSSSYPGSPISPITSVQHRNATDDDNLSVVSSTSTLTTRSGIPR